MNSAENVVNEHLAKDGVEKTTVHQVRPTPSIRPKTTRSAKANPPSQHALPAVEHEHVQREQKEKEYVAIDRERHQDHHQTKVQPIVDSEVLPEQHHHVSEAAEKRVFAHGDDKAAERDQAAEADALGVHENKRTVSKAQATQDEAQVLEGEHIHHHVHETVQPVIQKETIEPHVVHKTKTVKEVHQHEPQHHAAEQLPPVTIDEFKKQGGKLDGETAERVETHEGEPEAAMGSAGYKAPTTRTTSRATPAVDSREGTPAAAGEKEEPGLLKRMAMGAGL